MSDEFNLVQLLLEAPDDMVCFKFCPTNPNYVAGGCMNGQLVLWDISHYEEKLINAKAGGGAGQQKKVVSSILCFVVKFAQMRLN